MRQCLQYYGFTEERKDISDLWDRIIKVFKLENTLRYFEKKIRPWSQIYIYSDW